MRGSDNERRGSIDRVGSLTDARQQSEHPKRLAHGHRRAVALVALIAGILILVMPRLLNYIVAVYLILIGILGLLGNYSG